jgi:1,2-diacylglycerol 3-alpha-glucosyltransferase
MKSCSELTVREAKGIKFFFTDIDDTLTRDGKLDPAAYEALWLLRKHRIKVVPVTGRPAGWCDCIVRQWPVEAVIGENGAFAFYLERGKKQSLFHPDFRRGEGGERLAAVRDEILTKVKGALVAKDQPYRLSDLAIDFREEGDLALKDAVRIREIAESFGARGKISSIHVNIWFGSFDKFSMTEYLLRERFNIELSGKKDAVSFCGDSPNDEPMFQAFPLSFAVGNVRKYMHLIEQKPKFIAEKEYGQGFREIVMAIIDKIEK